METFFYFCPIFFLLLILKWLFIESFIVWRVLKDFCLLDSECGLILWNINSFLNTLGEGRPASRRLLNPLYDIKTKLNYSGSRWKGRGIQGQVQGLKFKSLYESDKLWCQQLSQKKKSEVCVLWLIFVAWTGCSPWCFRITFVSSQCCLALTFL